MVCTHMPTHTWSKDYLHAKLTPFLQLAFYEFILSVKSVLNVIWDCQWMCGEGLYIMSVLCFQFLTIFLKLLLKASRVGFCLKGNC